MNNISRAVALGVLAVSLGVSTALSAAATETAALPAADGRLFVLTCDTDFPYALGELNTVTGVVTPVGESVTGQCWPQAAYNAVDGLIYGVDWSSIVDGYPVLSTINPDTGETLTVAPITDLRDGGAPLSFYALAINSDGEAFAASDTSLFSLNLSTGDATYIGEFLQDGQARVEFYSFAFNPIDNDLYTVNWGPQDVFTVNTSDASLSLVDDSWNTETATSNAGLAFDSNGIGWFQNEGLTGFFSADVTDIAGTRSTDVPFTYNDVNFYAESLVYVPADVVDEALAETGVRDSLYGTAALAVVLAAAGIVVARLRRS